jgi:hypothetical protein
MFTQWSSAGGTPGAFALRGIIPWVYNCEISLFPFLIPNGRYLQNGNILAARTFIKHFTSALPKDLQPSPIPVGSMDEVILTKDSIVNFSQIAVLTCQRAQGDKNKLLRESWVRLCGTYQSRGGILASPPVRQV